MGARNYWVKKNLDTLAAPRDANNLGMFAKCRRKICCLRQRVEGAETTGRVPESARIQKRGGFPPADPAFSGAAKKRGVYERASVNWEKAVYMSRQAIGVVRRVHLRRACSLSSGKAGAMIGPFLK